MAEYAREVSNAERGICALLGAAFSILALQRGSFLARSVTGMLGAALLVRAATGQPLLQPLYARRAAHRAFSDAIDTSVDHSFPASDPPASRIPDDPPANAEAKWAAHRAHEANKTTH
jgi:uncharacterized membrane protein